MALTKYHRRGMLGKIGTKRLSKKLGVEIKSLGWQMFSITLKTGIVEMYNSNKETLEENTIESINKIGIKNIKPYPKK